MSYPSLTQILLPPIWIVFVLFFIFSNAAVYQIKCLRCNSIYIGETSWHLKTHIQAVHHLNLENILQVLIWKVFDELLHFILNYYSFSYKIFDWCNSRWQLRLCKTILPSSNCFYIYIYNCCISPYFILG